VVGQFRVIPCAIFPETVPNSFWFQFVKLAADGWHLTERGNISISGAGMETGSGLRFGYLKFNPPE